jgi:hypothetical protein
MKNRRKDRQRDEYRVKFIFCQEFDTNGNGFFTNDKSIKKMGYTYVQYSGAPYDPQMLKRVSLETEMPIVLTHVPMDRIIGDTEELMEEHALFGCKNIGLGAMPEAVIKDEAACKQTIAKLNAAAEKMHAKGFKFFYHHHQKVKLIGFYILLKYLIGFHL